MWHWLSKNKFGQKRISHHFFASYHGHSLADAHAASIKRSMRTDYNRSQLQRFSTTDLAVYWECVCCAPVSQRCECALWMNGACARVRLYRVVQLCLTFTRVCVSVSQRTCPPLHRPLLQLQHLLLPPLHPPWQISTLHTREESCMASREMRLASGRSVERGRQLYSLHCTCQMRPRLPR